MNCEAITIRNKVFFQGKSNRENAEAAAVLMGMANNTVQVATSTLFSILWPRFHGCANTVLRFSSVGVKAKDACSAYTSRGILKAVMKIQKMGKTITPAINKTPAACRHSKLQRRAHKLVGEGSRRMGPFIS